MSERFNMLSGYKHAPQTLGRVLVLGLGKSGRAVSEYCAELLGSRVASLHVAGGAYSEENEAFAQNLRKKGAHVVFDTYRFDEHYDVCIASPGIAEGSEFYQAAFAASTELISEVEFAWRESAADSYWIAITGTNGKTTTTSMITHILNRAHLAASAVGNIGTTCIEAVAAKSTTHYVVEVSSYQLASIKFFAPNVAVLLNITPDHISWHGDFQHYKEAKLKLFSNLEKSEGAVAILNASDDETRCYVKHINAIPENQRGFSYIPIGAKGGLACDMRAICASQNAAFIEDDMFVVAWDGVVLHPGAVSDLRVKGLHNIVNALASASAALVAGVDSIIIASALSTFDALEHRIEPCGSIEGVACYNDSKATNVDATLVALSAFGDQKPIVLLGGYDKGTELDALVAAAENHAKAVVCYGAAGPRFMQAFAASSLPSLLKKNLEQALDQALNLAQEGDVVLLSPACASFDEFSSFEHRGEEFKAYVQQRSSERGE